MRSDNMPRPFAPENDAWAPADIVARLRNEASDGDHLGVNEQTITTAYLREAADEIERLRAENESWKSQVHEEIIANLAFREAGGALPDEDMPTFCTRLVAERDRLRERIERAPVVKVRGKIGEFATIVVSHSLLGKTLRLVEEG